MSILNTFGFYMRILRFDLFYFFRRTSFYLSFSDLVNLIYSNIGSTFV